MNSRTCGRLMAWLGAGAIALGITLSSGPGAHGAFGPSVNVNTSAMTDKYENGMPTVAAGPDGVAIAVWQGTGPTPLGPQGDDSADLDLLNDDLFYARSLDGGKTWGPKALLKTNYATDDADDVYPTIATDGQGRWMVVWRSKDSLKNTIGYDRDVLMTFSADNGVSWSAPAPVNNDAATDGSVTSGKEDMYPHVASDGLGRWVVVWASHDNRSGAWRTTIRMTSTTNNGVTWSAPVLWQDLPNMYNTFPDLQADGLGHWIALWQYSPNGVAGNNERIAYATSSDSGATWSASPLTLNATGLGASSSNNVPGLATNQQGGWVIAWNSSDPLGGALGTDSDVLFSRSGDNGVTWSAPAALNIDAASDGAENDHSVRISCTAQGRFIAVWNATKFGGNTEFAYATSGDGGASWSSIQRLSIDPVKTGDSVAYGNTHGMDMTPIPGNGILAVWTSNRDRALWGHNWDILGALWPASLVPVELGGFTAD